MKLISFFEHLGGGLTRHQETQKVPLSPNNMRWSRYKQSPSETYQAIPFYTHLAYSLDESTRNGDAVDDLRFIET